MFLLFWGGLNGLHWMAQKKLGLWIPIIFEIGRERFRIRVVAPITRVSFFWVCQKISQKKTPKVHGDKPSLSPLKMAIKLVCIAYENREIHLRSMFQLSSSSFPFGCWSQINFIGVFKMGTGWWSSMFFCFIIHYLYHHDIHHILLSDTIIIND